MTIGLLRIELMITGAMSLKDRRRVVKSLKERLRSRYNCSIAEVGDKETWNRASLAVCVVSDDSRFANSELNEIVRFASMDARAQLLDYHIEMM